MGRLRGEGGFTLPELMIVIVLLGILAAIAMPTWWGIVESRKVESATNQVVADLRLAHTSATNRLGTASVYLDTREFGRVVSCGSASNVDYCLVRPTPGGVPKATPGRLPGGIGIKVWNFGTDTSVNGGDVSGAHRAMDFGADGTAGTRGAMNATATDCPSPAAGGMPVIAVAPDDASAPERCIEINTQTSRVEIVD